MFESQRIAYTEYHPDPPGPPRRNSDQKLCAHPRRARGGAAVVRSAR